MWSAEQHIVDSTTVNLGPPDMPGQNLQDRLMGQWKYLLGPHDGVVVKMVPALASNSDFAHQYLRNDHIREQNTFYKSVL